MYLVFYYQRPAKSSQKVSRKFSMGMLLLLNKFRVGLHMRVTRRKKEMVQKTVKIVRKLFYGKHFILQGGSQTSNSISSNKNSSSSNNNF